MGITAIIANERPVRTPSCVLYQVFENDKLIMEDTPKAIHDKIGLDNRVTATYSRTGNKYLGKYRLVKVG